MISPAGFSSLPDYTKGKVYLLLSGKWYDSYKELSDALSACTKNITAGENVSKPAQSGGGVSKASDAPVISAGGTAKGTAKDEAAFSDLIGYEWASEAIAALHDKKIVNGTAEKIFSPERNVTRAEFISMVVRAFDINGDGDIYSDTPADEWYTKNVCAASAHGIVTGDNGFFRPNDNITREDIAVVLYRASGADTDKPCTFSDSGDISDYAVGGVSFLYHECGISGYPDGAFRPKAFATRAEAAKLLYSVLRKIN